MDDKRPDKQQEHEPRERPLEIDSGTEYSAAPLAAGAQVDSFTVGKLVCNSFSGFTYTGTDGDNRRAVIIQEYFPEEVSVRDLDRVSLLLRDETVSNEFEFGLTRFYRLTRALSRINGKGRAVACLEQNDTAYYAMPFDFRCTLNNVLSSGKIVPGANIENWLKSCLRYLVAPHEANLLHLGIQADSILLDGEGDAILVGFNSVGPAFHTEPHKPEYLYLPIERIRSEAEMIPASDLYSLAAVFLHCMSGEPPPHAARRTGAVSTGRPDPVDEQIKAIEERHSPSLVRVVKWMLAPQPKDRPQTAIEALDALDAGAARAIPTVRTVASKSPKGAAANQRPESQPVRPAGHRKDAAGAASRKALPETPGKPDAAAAATADSSAETPVVLPPAETAPAKPAKPDSPTAPSTDTPRHGTGVDEVSAPGPSNWFRDEELETIGRSPVSRILGHPLTWVGAAVLALVGAYFWLDGSSLPDEDQVAAEPLPRINVVPSNEAAGPSGDPAPSAAESTPQVVLESASSITAPNDNERFQTLRKLDALERKLEPHFLEAETHLSNGRLTVPDNGNALAAFNQVLSIDPGNPRAVDGIATIKERLTQRAETALEKGDLDTAEQEIAKLAEIEAGNSAVERIRGEIAQVRLQRELEAEAARRQAEEEERQRQAEQQRQQQLQELMGRAIASFDGGRLVEPPLDNALYYYREMLKIDPQSNPANAGIQQIAAQFVRQARQGLANNDLESADRNLTTAAAIDPANADIPPVREQIDTRRRLVEQEQRALAEARQSQEEARQAAQSQAEMSLQSGIGAYYRGDYNEAYSFLRPLAENGNARAQFRLAVMLQNGRGVQTNRAEARKWFLAALEPIRIAANSGLAWAQADLGSYYEDGIILDANYAEAARWYMRAAEQGYAGAQTNLGVMYANGQGVEPDMNQAIEWFKRAAIQGDSVAKENLRILGHDPDRITLGASG